MNRKELERTSTLFEKTPEHPMPKAYFNIGEPEAFQFPLSTIYL
jgi:hypothetical protein